MKKRFGVCSKICLACSLLTFGAIVGASAFELTVDDLKDSGATRYIQNLNDIAEFSELVGRIQLEDPISTARNQSILSYANEMNNLSKDLTASDEAIEQLAKFLSCFESGERYEMTYDRESLDTMYGGAFPRMMEIFKKQGYEVSIDKYDSKTVMVQNEDKASHTVDFDSEMQLGASINMDTLIGEKSSESFMKDMKIVMAASGNGSIDFMDELMADYISLIGQLSGRGEGFPSNMVAVLKPLLAKINSMDCDLKYDVGIGASINAEGMGGKILANIHLAVDNEIDDEFIERLSNSVKAVGELFSGRGVDFQSIMDFPVDLKVTLKFFNDDGTSSYSLIDADSLGGLLLNIMSMGM